MLKNEKVKKIVLCLMLIGVLALLFKTTFATDDEFENYFEDEDPEQIQEGNRPGNNTPENGTPGNNTPENNTPENAPTKNADAGLEDGSTIVFIAIFAVSAVYAYKKVKDYKI